MKESVQLISTCELSDFSDLRKHTSCEFGDQAACGWCDYAFIRAGFRVHKGNKLNKKKVVSQWTQGGGGTLGGLTPQNIPHQFLPTPS